MTPSGNETRERELKWIEKSSKNLKPVEGEHLTEEQKDWYHKKNPDDPSIQKADRSLTLEEWKCELMRKYEYLKIVADDNFPGLWYSVEFELSVQKILNIQDCTLPFAGIVLGRPSSLKTVGIELFREWHNTYYTDNFSAKSFVSHSTAVNRNQLAAIDMLPRIKNKLFLTPELSPTFSKKDDDLVDILGILTRVLDGHGYESDSGAHGHRGYNEPIMFAWIGAAVDIPYKVHKYLGTLGPKLYFLRLPSVIHSEEEYFDDFDKDFAVNLGKIKEALFEYLEWFEKGPNLQRDPKSGIMKMVWNDGGERNEDSVRAKKCIIKLAILLSHLRGVVPTWGTNEPTSEGLGYAYTLATIEDPSRAITQLRNLARGHALSRGRNYVAMEDIPLLTKVVFSTASLERVRIFELLIEFGGSLTTSQITDSLNTSNNTAKRTMAELRAVGLVSVSGIESRNGSPEKQITLKDDFKWFLSDDFKSVRKLPPYNNKQGQGLGGYFSYTYGKSVLLKSVLPRSSSLNIENIEINKAQLDSDVLVITQPGTDKREKHIQGDPREVEASRVTESQNLANIYRKWQGSDTWACKNCNLTGDIWFMKGHPCKSLNRI